MYVTFVSESLAPSMFHASMLALLYALLRVDRDVWCRIPGRHLLPYLLTGYGVTTVYYMFTSATSPLFFRWAFAAMAAMCTALVR